MVITGQGAKIDIQDGITARHKNKQEGNGRHLTKPWGKRLVVILGINPDYTAHA